MKMPEVSHTPQADRKHGESEVTIEFFKGNMVNIERLTVEQAKALYQSLADFLDGAPELDPYDDFCPTCDAPNPWHTETCSVPFRPVNSALDGAPEPEWEWGYAGETLVGVHNSISREAAEEAVANLRRYWNDERKFWGVRRTPASEWLPVEGEGR